MPSAAPTVWLVPRNDIAAARRFWRSRRGPLNSDEARVLARLQDDPSELLAVMQREGWVAAETGGSEQGDMTTDSPDPGGRVTVALLPGGRVGVR